MESQAHLDRIVRETGSADLLEVLAERLRPTDFQSLLVEVARRRAERTTSARTFERYRKDPFVKPSPIDPRILGKVDRIAFSLAESEFKPVELSPVCPLGTVSATTNISQNKVLSTIRGTEVVADCTNVLALEIAARRRFDRGPDTALCASHRLLRVQAVSGPVSFGHFRVFTLATGGRNRGDYRFETASLVSHIGFYLRLLSKLGERGFAIGRMRVVITAWDEARLEAAEARLYDPLTKEFPEVAFALDSERVTGRSYYEGLAFHLYAEDAGGNEQFLADGGALDWTRTLLASDKERLVTSGIGTERLCAAFRAGKTVG